MASVQTSPGSVEGYARDIVEGLRLLGVRRFALVGHSLGGAVATAVAELVPDQVSALVLLAPAGFGRIRLAEAISVPGVRNVVGAALPFALSSRLAVTAAYVAVVTNEKSPTPDVVSRVTSRGGYLADGAREGTKAVVDAGRARDAFYRRRSRYTGPVHAVWGDRDRLVPVSHRHGLLNAFPHASIELWEGMGHHPVSERLGDLLSVIRSATSPARRRRPLRVQAQAA
ncbi:MAG: alpha/beta fold hydrolase [Solirubrobacteraceae bacterium]